MNVSVHVLFLAFLLSKVKSQQCLQAARPQGDDVSPPDFNNRDRVDDSDKITHRHQAIVTSYQFVDCCGVITEDLVCKIGDFGMARDLEDDEVYFSQGGKIPIKWTAPEALNYRKFSTASDVWSYGMVLFEIWSLGKKPFERVTTNKLMELLNSGYCQPPPPGCPRAIYQLMVQCWHYVPSKRLRFSEICDYLNSTDDLLLNWSSADRTVSERVTELGAPLSEARNLYPDLQYTYDSS